MSLNKRLINPNPGADGFTTWTQSTTYSTGLVGGTTTRMVGGWQNNFFKFEASGTKIIYNTIPSSGSTLTNIYNITAGAWSGQDPSGVTDWASGYYGGNNHALQIFSFYSGQTYSYSYRRSDGLYQQSQYQRPTINLCFSCQTAIVADAIMGHLYSPTGVHCNGCYYFSYVGRQTGSPYNMYINLRSTYNDNPTNSGPWSYNVHSTLSGYQSGFMALIWDGSHHWIIASSASGWWDALKYDFFNRVFVGNPISLGYFGGYDNGTFPAGGWFDPGTGKAYIGGAWGSKLYSFTLS